MEPTIVRYKRYAYVVIVVTDDGNKFLGHRRFSYAIGSRVGVVDFEHARLFARRQDANAAARRVRNSHVIEAEVKV